MSSATATSAWQAVAQQPAPAATPAAAATRTLRPSSRTCSAPRCASQRVINKPRPPRAPVTATLPLKTGSNSAVGAGPAGCGSSTDCSRSGPSTAVPNCLLWDSKGRVSLTPPVKRPHTMLASAATTPSAVATFSTACSPAAHAAAHDRGNAPQPPMVVVVAPPDSCQASTLGAADDCSAWTRCAAARWPSAALMQKALPAAVDLASSGAQLAPAGLPPGTQNAACQQTEYSMSFSCCR
jgi:hypothetical protein